MTAPTDPPIRVLLVDDEPLIRSGLTVLVGCEPDLVVVGEAPDGEQGVARALELRPRVVVMDLRMPVLDGVAATRTLTTHPLLAEGPDLLSVLVLTTFDGDDAVHAALRAGASGYVLKASAPRDLAPAIRALAQGHGWIDPVVTRTLLADAARRPDPLTPTPDELRRLTPREREVLSLVAHGLTNAQIAAHLVVSDATVRTHLGRVLVKLGLHDRAHAVAVAYQTGLVVPGDLPPARAGMR